MTGREQELGRLQECYGSDRFELLAVYGRRQIGKTTLLRAFAESADVIYFAAQEKNAARCLADFSRTAKDYFRDTEEEVFSDWKAAFSYISDNAGEDRMVLILDEFPYLAAADPSVLTALREAIDLDFRQRNLFLILSGSNASYMVNQVIGGGALSECITGVMELTPFDYYDAAGFFPDYDAEDKLLAYGILGGIPGYIRAFDPHADLRTNLAERLIRTGAVLNEEPQLQLNMQLREPGVYNSILEAIANGYDKVTEMAAYIQETKNKVSKYLLTMQDIRAIEKVLPCLDPPESKKGVYRLSDLLYRFWFRFIFTDRSYYELQEPETAADEILEEINEYMEPVFAQIFCQYLNRAAKEGRLPFVPAASGKWWGSNALKKEQTEIDVMAVSEDGAEAVFGKCRFQDRPMLMEDYDELMAAADHFEEIETKHFYLLSKGGYTDRVADRARADGTILLTIDDLFDF